jgi:small subunit ribosomal protein S9
MVDDNKKKVLRRRLTIQNHTSNTTKRTKAELNFSVKGEGISIGKTEKSVKENDTENIRVREMEVKIVSNAQVKLLKKTADENVSNSLKERFYATGKRKNAVARVWIKKGTGTIMVNGLKCSKYFKRPLLNTMVFMPFMVTQTMGQFDVLCTVEGGGLSGQAGAARQALAKAMVVYNSQAYRKELKIAGLLTRDSRKVERKKPGLKKARKDQVFSKR